jgi:thiol-disulfide isomerase/thioredoxin
MDLSGHERDKLFLSHNAKGLVDVSYLSGADGVEDARAFAKADLDRDGYEDMIVVNRNAPLLRVYRNQLGPATKNHFIGLHVEGAKQHDAIGARIRARGCGVTQTREVSAGTGFATVDAMAITLGLGSCDELDELTVRFPAGEQRTFKNVAADAFYRAIEGKGLQAVAGVYDHANAAAPVAHVDDTTPRLAKLAASAKGQSPLVLVDLFATWCEACVRTAPRLDAMTTALAGKLDIVGVTVEPSDDAAAVERFRVAHSIGHPMVAFDAAVAAEVNVLFGSTPPLPSTLIIDRKTGSIVLQTRGSPTRSDLERVLTPPI